MTPIDRRICSGSAATALDPRSGRAEAAFREAIVVAREQGARTFSCSPRSSRVCYRRLTAPSKPRLSLPPSWRASPDAGASGHCRGAAMLGELALNSLSAG